MIGHLKPDYFYFIIDEFFFIIIIGESGDVLIEHMCLCPVQVVT